MGISSLLNTLGLVGFLLLIVGIVQTTISISRGQRIRGNILLAGIGLVVGVLFSAVGQSVLVLQPNEVAVIFNTSTGAFESPRHGGASLIFPVFQQATVYDISQQSYTMVLAASPQDQDSGGIPGDDSIQGRTIDGQDVWVGVTILYGINPAPESINDFHVRWGETYQQDFIRPTVRSIVRDVISRFHASELYSEVRTEMEQMIEETVTERLAREGFILTDFLVRGVRFSQQFTQAVEDKLAAEQEALQAAFQVQREQQFAEQMRVRARGEADAVILQAQAEAEALRLVSEQIAANPSLIQYLYVQNLSDNINLALVPSNTPFLFDINSLLANPDFVAPQVPESSTAPSAEATSEATPGG